MQNLTTSSSTGDSRMEERNVERREKRIKRENLLREYTQRRDAIKADLERYKKETAELENKIRFQDGAVQEGKARIVKLKEDLKRIEKKYRQDYFDLRTNKSRVMDIQKETDFLEKELALVEKKLKKVRIEGED